MSEQCRSDFSIRRLGECRYDSPLHLSHVKGDLIADFVRDDEKILLYNRLSDLERCREEGIEPPYFEAAGPREKIYFNPADCKVGIVTCGGLCPGINDVIRGLVLKLYLGYGVKTIYGLRYGFAGLVENSGFEPMMLDPEVVEDQYHKGGTFLGSSRGPQSVEAMVDFMAKRGLNLLFTIGGDGTQRGALALVTEIEKRKLDIAVVGVPKTIDNDVQYVEKSFGFETAYSVATDVLLSAHAEARGAYNGITIVKLMGRHSGFLTASAAIASGEVNFVLLPELPFDLEPPYGFLAALEERILLRHHALVVVAEGAGQEFFDGTKIYDKSGNVKLGDIGTFLVDEVQEYFKRRNIEAAVRYIDPSYYVRSTQATPADRMFCLRLAHNAVHAAMTGRTGMIVGRWNSSYTHVPTEAAVESRKVLDPESDLWLTVLQTTGQPNRMKN